MQTTYLGFKPGFLNKPPRSTEKTGCTKPTPKKDTSKDFPIGFKSGFLIKRGKKTQTECLQPPASSPDSILFNPDFFELIKSFLSIQSMRTLSSSSRSLRKEIRPILKKLNK